MWADTHTNTCKPLNVHMRIKVHTVDSMVHTYSTHTARGAGRYKAIPVTSTPSTFPQEISTCDRCWKETLQCIVQNLKWGEKTFPLSAGCNLVNFPPLFTFHDETEEEKVCHWWWGKMKSAPLKCKRSVRASEHYGVPFSSINLPIFHGCGGLFIDQWMIKWWSTEGPSSFSFLFFTSFLFLTHSLYRLFLSFPRCLYLLTLSPHPPLFHNNIHYTTHQASFT